MTVWLTTKSQDSIKNYLTECVAVHFRENTPKLWCWLPIKYTNKIDT